MRVIADGTLGETVAYYETFPCEPTVDPNSMFPIDLPIAREDRLRPITLVAILDRMLTLQEREVLILCHGTEDGLVVPLVSGSRFHAEKDNLRLLTQLGNARSRAQEIRQLPAAQRAGAWVGLLSGLRGADRQPFIQGRIEPGQADSAYERLLERVQTDAANKMHLSNAQLSSLLDKRNRVRGTLDRIEFRSCNTGRSRTAMVALCQFFGSRQVIAPDVVAFTARFSVSRQPQFERHFDQQVRAQTARMLRGRATRPDRGYPGHGRQPDALPPVRSFDVNSAAGDEVFLRMWATSMHSPHRFAGWLVAKSRGDVRAWLQQEVMADTTRYHDGAPVPLVGLWLRDDQDAPVAPHRVVFDTDPLALPPPPPPFALPLDSEYREHLVSVGAGGGARAP